MPFRIPREYASLSLVAIDPLPTDLIAYRHWLTKEIDGVDAALASFDDKRTELAERERQKGKSNEPA